MTGGLVLLRPWWLLALVPTAALAVWLWRHHHDGTTAKLALGTCLWRLLEKIIKLARYYIGGPRSVSSTAPGG